MVQERDADSDSSRRLLERAKAGDDGALDTLYSRYLPRLLRFGRGRLPVWARERLETEDLVQETLVQTLGRIEGFEPRWEGALQAYLRQALLNRVRDEVRRAGRRPRAAELPPDEADDAPSPLEEVLGREAVARYEAALARLKEDDRAAIVARVELGCTYKEIADALARPSPDAARMAVSRALLRLAEEMSRGR